MRKTLGRLAALLVTISIVISMMSAIVFAAPSAAVDQKNNWGDGGQITLNLSGCSGYSSVTVVVQFNGTINSASGWGFDTYTVSGNQVTATVSASGPNSWGMNGNVGIQVSGSNISDCSLVSISGDGQSGSTGDQASQTSAPADSGNNGGNGGSDNTTPATVTEGVQGDDWLATDGSKIVDLNGNEVWVTGVNWFGYNTGTNLFDGVWNCNLQQSLKGIADHGFNFLRVPISAELLLQWKNGEYPNANYNQALNSELNGMNSLEIFDYVLTLCEQYGIKVMLDIHSANTDAAGHNHAVWYTDRISEEQFIEALAWVADRYKDNDTILAYDLKNEPHGKANETPHAIWNDSEDANNWKYIAEKAANAVLDANPYALVVVEGIQIYPTDIATNNFQSVDEEDYYNTWWGANLMGVKDYPMDLGSEARNRQIVYSAHDYGPLVYEQPWFEGGFTYDSLYEDAWHDYWFYIIEEDIAPVFIGEWGGFMQGDNLTWMTYLRQLIGEYNIPFTFWCYNANSGDTGGLIKDDFTTWDDEKYSFVKEVLWTDGEGKFIGLDHEVPLGANGISLSDYTGSSVTPVEPGSVPTVEETEVTNTPEATSESTLVTTPEAETKGGIKHSTYVAVMVVLSVICAAAVGVIAVMVLKIYKLDKKDKADDSDEEKPVVINGYLQKSNTASVRPVYSNTRENRKAQEAKEAKKEVEKPDVEPVIKPEDHGKS